MFLEYVALGLLCFVGLLIWPFLWIWATLDRPGKGWDFEAGYRHLWNDSDITENNVTLENSSDGNLYGAVNYRF